MTILEILEAHTLEWVADDVGNYECACGFYPDPFNGTDVSIDNQHRAHLAEVLDKNMQEREAEAKREALNEVADEIYRLDGDDAEMYNEDLNATPVTVWLRARANQYKENQ